MVVVDPEAEYHGQHQSQGGGPRLTIGQKRISQNHAPEQNDTDEAKHHDARRTESLGKPHGRDHEGYEQDEREHASCPDQVQIPSLQARDLCLDHIAGRDTKPFTPVSEEFEDQRGQQQINAGEDPDLGLVDVAFDTHQADRDGQGHGHAEYSRQPTPAPTGVVKIQLIRVKLATEQKARCVPESQCQSRSAGEEHHVPPRQELLRRHTQQVPTLVVEYKKEQDHKGGDDGVAAKPEHADSGPDPVPDPDDQSYARTVSQPVDQGIQTIDEPIAGSLWRIFQAGLICHHSAPFVCLSKKRLASARLAGFACALTNCWLFPQPPTLDLSALEAHDL